MQVTSGVMDSARSSLVVDSVTHPRTAGYMLTQSGPLREMNGFAGCWPIAAKWCCRPMLRTCVKTERDDPETGLDQAFTKVVTTPADALQILLIRRHKLSRTPGDGLRTTLPARYQGLVAKWYPVPSYSRS